MGRDEPDRRPSIRSRRLDRRTFLAATGGGPLAATLAGCLDDSSETRTVDRDSNGNGNGNETDGERDDRTDDEPTLDGTFTIGHLAPLETTQGIGSDRSARLAAETVNDEGGVRGREVAVRSVDTRADPSVAQGASERLIHEEEVDLLVGTFSDAVAHAVLKSVANVDVPFIVTGSASPTVIERSTGDDYARYRNVFRAGPLNRTFQADLLADYADYLADRHDWTDFAVLQEAADWTLPFSERLPAELVDRGYDLVYHDRLSVDIDDFSPVLSELSDANPDAVFRFSATSPDRGCSLPGSGPSASSVSRGSTSHR